MKLIKKLSSIAIVAALAIVAFVHMPTTVQAQDPPFGPWVDEIVFSQNEDSSIVLTEIINGDEDYYLFTVIGATNKLRAVADPNIWTIHTFGSFNGFVMNPLPQQSGFNPFTLAEVREAVQWLVDRELIARETYSGFAAPFYGPYHPKSADYGRFIDAFIQLQDKYATDPAQARSQIDAAMTAAGASKDANDKWRDSNGDLVEITVYMRIEDERLLEGAYLADLLSGMGFTVNPQPVDRTFISAVYGGPSDQNLWHVYTEGWISTAQINIDDFQIYDFYGCYWEDWCLESGVYENGYKPPTELFDTYEAIALGDYSSFDEREAWIRDVLPDLVPNAYRAWTIAEESVYPVNNRVSAAYDLFGGPVHELFSRTAMLSDAPGDAGEGGTLRAVNLLAGQDAWNPYIFVGTLYDSDIRDTVNDFGTLRHPHTGRIIPARLTNPVVVTEGPDGVLSVPSTALMYDAPNNTWAQVGAGVDAVSKVDYDFAMGNWHHNVSMNMVDVRHEISQLYRRCFGDMGDAINQTNSCTSGTAVQVARFKGFEFGTDHLTVYVDFFHLDPMEIFDFAAFWPDAPWEVHEVMAQAMIDGELAASEVDSTALSIPWMDQTKGASLAVLDSKLADLRTANHKPVGSESLVSNADATARWDALNDFVTNFGHYFISGGPFYLDNFDTSTWSFTVKAHRDYPFRADHWEEYRFPAIPDLSLTAPETVFSGSAANFDFVSTVAGVPYDDIETQWFLKDLTTKQFIEQGTASQVGSGSYRITLSAATTDELLFGNFEMILVVSSEAAAPPSIARAPFLVLPSVAWFEGRLSATESALQADITALEQQQSELTQSVNDATAATEGLVLLVTTLAVLAVIAVVVAVVSVILVLRGRGGT